MERRYWILVGVCLLIGLIFGLVGIIFAFMIVGQVYLSKLQSKWYGLILPSITFLYSLVGILGIILYNSIFELIVNILAVFVMLNIPTAVLIAIYKGIRQNMKNNNEMKKMNIQDLG